MLKLKFSLKKRVAFYGVGREGLAMKAFAMRLFHMGFDVSVVGEMTATKVGDGDLLIASAGPGYFSTVCALANEARRDAAQVLIFTSQPPHLLADIADNVVRIPATCLPPADGGGEQQQASPSLLLMGSSYELALHLFFDVLCLLLQEVLEIGENEMKKRHTNLE